MKKLVIAGAIAAFGLVSAQKNTLLVGGNISYNNETKKNFTNAGDLKSDDFEFTPMIGYQFADHFTAGVKLAVGSSKADYYQTVMNGWDMYDAITNIKTNSFTYGVFGRYTLPLNETFSVFGDLDVLFNNTKSTVAATGPYAYTTTTKSNGFGIGFTPNLFINFKNSFGLNFNIGGISYQSEKIKDSDMKTNAFGFGFGKGVTVGISKNFGLK
ncbi:outer membrane beta-barrel protein [Epilithonimonas arachidiradicis]|uniref:Flavo-specific protein antigen FspA n=1 Tax=Epilithonimonas arachidiradicis TaxID=1617282 RepID=A0A420DA60_9FLAO|nr:outer membrane beta-barrel protein [Epilithonimonas arachidiradicis]RKE88101.1 outer membrane protein with beta-barrel domain [Epilithonimonas arachidiradicis]GGG51341.1 flavo-specific protein antigen FspA [Epilithonimonas arachidiradicis]